MSDASLNTILELAGSTAMVRLLIAAVTVTVVIIAWWGVARVVFWPFRKVGTAGRRGWLVLAAAAVPAGFWIFVPGYPGAVRIGTVYFATVTLLVVLNAWRVPRMLFLPFYTALRRYLWFGVGFVVLYGLLDAGLRGTPAVAASGLYVGLLGILTVAAGDAKVWAVCAHASSRRWHKASGKIRSHDDIEKLNCPACAGQIEIPGSAVDSVGQCEMCGGLIKVMVDEAGDLFLAEVPREIESEAERTEA